MIISHLCCACLEDSVSMRPLRSEWKNSVWLHEMLDNILNESHDCCHSEQLPNICLNCELALISCYEFKQKCNESREKLADTLSSLAANKPSENKEENVLISVDVIVDGTKHVGSEHEEGEHGNEKIVELVKQESNPKEVEKKKSHRLNLDPNFRHCLRCNLKFPDDKAYQTHHRQTHRDRNLCPLCGKLVTRQAMDKHIASHTKAKNHLCTECGKRFTLSENLKKHVRIHTGDKHYQCEHCGEKFIHWNSKRSHVRTVHTGEMKYVCNICGKRFAQSSNMFRHVRQHTGELPHECEFCHKKFISSPELRNHLVTHTKERNHKCTMCNKAFGTKKALRTHIKIHNNERNYVCSVCRRAFSQAHVLRSHLRKVHPDCPLPAPGVVLSQKALNKVAEAANAVSLLQ